MFKSSLFLIILLFLAAACSSEGLHGAVFEPPRVLEDFSIPSSEGENFTLSEHRGEVILLYFGYLACPDFCPTTFGELRGIYRELGEPEDRLKIVFVTVDPERDSLERLTNYVHAFHEDFIGIRAEGAELDALKTQFGIVAERNYSGESYTIDHTASLFLIGVNGELEAQYLYGTDYELILQDLRHILESL